MGLISTTNIGSHEMPLLRVVNAYEVPSWSAYHFYLLFLAGIPLILMLYVFVYTFLIIQDLNARDTIINNLFREAKIHFGFLVLGFRRKWWWWTYLRWVRRLLVSSLIAEVLLSTDIQQINFNFYWIIVLLVIN